MAVVAVVVIVSVAGGWAMKAGGKMVGGRRYAVVGKKLPISVAGSNDGKGGAPANRLGKKKAAWVVGRYILHIGVWVIVSNIYKAEKGLDDLWGWSCSEKAQAVQKFSGGEIDFGVLCQVQVSCSP